jgi:hypothetical protein
MICCNITNKKYVGHTSILTSRHAARGPVVKQVDEVELRVVVAAVLAVAPDAVFVAQNLLNRGAHMVTALARQYEHSEQARAPHTNGPRDVPRCGALSLIQKTLRTRFNSKPNGTEATDASRSVRARRGSQNLSGAEVWAAAFRGREDFFAFRFSLSFARTQLGNAPCGHALKLPL